jgi:tRNA (guanine-N7-)-methyltransferase
MNFIGIDRKGARLWRGAKTALEANMTNVAFLRTGIDAISHYFSSHEVSEIWITFPDPQPKKERRRLTSPAFIERYKQILTPQATIHLKTDSQELYLYTKETAEIQKWNILEDIDDVYANVTDENSVLVKVQTFYEKIWLKEGKKITYLKFKIDT